MSAVAHSARPDSPDGRGDDPRARLVPYALILAVSAISFAAIFFRLAAPTEPLVMAGVRLAIASLLLLPFTVGGFRAGRLQPRVFRAALWAGLAYAVHFGAWVTSLTITSVAASVTLVTTTPLLLAVVGLIRGRDKPDGRLWLSLALGAAGMTIIGANDLSFEGNALFGDGLALLGAGAMASYMLIVRRLGPNLDVMAFTGVATGVGALVLLGCAIGLGLPLIPGPEALFYLALAALVPQLIGHTLITWSLRHTKPTAVGIAILGEPVGSTVLGIFWLGEMVGGWVLVGCGLTLAGLAIAVLRRRVASETSPMPRNHQER